MRHSKRPIHRSEAITTDRNGLFDRESNVQIVQTNRKYCRDTRIPLWRNKKEVRRPIGQSSPQSKPSIGNGPIEDIRARNGLTNAKRQEDLATDTIWTSQDPSTNSAPQRKIQTFCLIPRLTPGSYATPQIPKLHHRPHGMCEDVSQTLSRPESTSDSSRN